MASLITGSARLILAIAESIAVKYGYISYMDTDSIFVSPNKVKEIQDFFRPLNPYSVNVEMFKIEEDDEHKPLDNVMFYGISAKRYCLYKINNSEINILKYSTHGLGHLKDIDGKQIWKSILTKDFKGYDDKMAVSQITISRPSILNRFKKMNSGNPYDKRIKPFSVLFPHCRNQTCYRYALHTELGHSLRYTSIPVKVKAICLMSCQFCNQQIFHTVYRCNPYDKANMV